MMAMLLLAYALNFLDRQIIGILAVPIKADLGLSDAQLGLMGGLAFAMLYTTLGIPVAMFADRHDRGLIMAVALFVWSLMTAACGLAQNFTQLFIARLGVGIGEAGGTAPAYSLVSDLYPAEQRARALALYSFGVPIGSASGIVFGGVIATMIDWRYAFFIVGLAGVLLAPVFRRVIHDPRPTKTAAPQPSVRLSQVLATLIAKRSFWLISLGSACSSMMGYGLFFWLPSFFVRSFHVSLLQASLSYGAILLVAGLFGIWLGGRVSDMLGHRGKAWFGIIPAVAFLATIPCYYLGVSSTVMSITLVLMLVPTALGLVWVGPVLAAVQGLVAPNMRATTSAIYLFINNLIGIGIGTAAIGWLSDHFKASHGDDALRHAILAGTGAYALAAVLLLLASRRLEADWHREPE